MKEKLNTKTALFVIFCFCVVCIVVTAVSVSFHIRSFSTPESEIRISAKNNVNYRVFYLENDIFENNTRPPGQFYLFSFTDYLEIENSFSTHFSQEADVNYQYTATGSLQIKHQKSSDNSTNPIVYEQTFILSEMSGNIKGDISFAGKEADEPGGVFVIDPKAFIDIYKHFVSEQHAQMLKENVITEKVVSFTAELNLNFSYRIINSITGINETITRGLSIPLMNEVFSPALTGTPVLETSIPIREFNMPGLSVIILFVLWISANIFGICYSIRQLTMEKNKQQRIANSILRKYADDIIVSVIPIELSEYECVPVQQFNDLLKLAMNTGKHILCFHNVGKAEFYIVDDRYLYYFRLYYSDDLIGDKEFNENGLESLSDL